MIIVKEKKTTSHLSARRTTYCEGRINLNEADNLPAIAKMGGVSTNPNITSAIRYDTIYDTVKAMGLPVKVNAMRNVVAEAPDSPTASAVATIIYQMFGVKCSFMLTWEGNMKLYWSPDTRPDQAPMLTYAKSAGLPPVNPRRYLS